MKFLDRKGNLVYLEGISLCVAWLFLGAAGHYLLIMVDITGNHVRPYPGSDLSLDYMLGLMWAILLGLSILVWPIPYAHKKALIIIWVFKVLATLFLMLGYEYRYSLDPDGYFTNAVSRSYSYAGFTLNGTLNTQFITRLHLAVVPGSFHAAKIAFSMAGLLGLFLYYKAAVLVIGRENIKILYGICLLPSTLLWSSVLGKEPILLFGVAAVVYSTIVWRIGNTRPPLMLLGIGIFLVVAVRFWYLLILLPAITYLGFATHRRILLKFGSLTAAILVGYIFLWPLLTQKLGISSYQDFIEYRNNAANSFEGGGSSVEQFVIVSPADFLSNAPAIVFRSLFRPLPFEIGNAFGLIQGIENASLLALSAAALFKFRRQEVKMPVVIAAGCFVLIWSLSYGLVVSNLGSLARFKVQVLPVFVMLLMYLISSGNRKYTSGLITKKTI